MKRACPLKQPGRFCVAEWSGFEWPDDGPILDLFWCAVHDRGFWE